MKLTERQKELLIELEPDEWVTPMWVGGSDGSHHSQTLRQLVKKGLAESRERPSICRIRSGKEYRRTSLGTETVEVLPQ